MKKNKVFSIVVPVYFNELNLPDTIPQLMELEHQLPGYRLELIFVDDGSGDHSLDILKEFQSRFPQNIKVVKLTRNFGSMAAIQAGLSIATGDCIGMISADLQDPVELFIEMIGHWEKGNKAIFAVRKDREEPFVQKSLSSLYYKLIRRLAIHDYPTGGFDFFLIDRQISDQIIAIKEKNTNLMALIFWMGYKPIMIPYIRKSRKAGKSRWTFKKKLKLFVDTFIGFSYFPIQILSLIGFLVAFVSFAYGVVIFLRWFIVGTEVLGWVPTMIVLTFTAGLQMTMLGILGEYLWRTLDENRGRPQYVIDEVFDLHDKEKGK